MVGDDVEWSLIEISKSALSSQRVGQQKSSEFLLITESETELVSVTLWIARI